jgi:hypothetical protein
VYCLLLEKGFDSIELRLTWDEGVWGLGEEMEERRR